MSKRAVIRLVAVVLLFVSLPAAAQTFVVPPLAPVVDQAGVISPATREQLARLIAEHERRTSNQVVVVTLASLGGLAIEDIGLQLGRTWRLGTRQHNNGALLVVAPKERKLRIEVGYGLEGQLPDARAFQIINAEIVPRFRAGDIEGGIMKGAIAIMASIEGSYAPPAPRKDVLDGRIVIPVFIILVVLVLVLNHRLVRQPGFRSGRHRVVSWGSSSSGSSSRRSSGGGGSFGGGGASGSW